jgi:alkaline phosphatase D
MIRLLLIPALCLITLHPLFAQLVSGPMPCAIHQRDVKIWFQLEDNAAPNLLYWTDDNPGTKLSAKVSPDKDFGNTAIVHLSGLHPGTTYRYTLDRNPKTIWSFTTQPLWQWRTDAPDFRLALGSCTYINDESFDRPGKPYGASYEIFESIASAKPDVMLWLGDNVYFREGDWDSRAGMVNRYTQTRSVPEMQKLLPICAHLAIWDDHDFGPNDATGNFILKKEALDVFNRFWGNPTTGVPSVKGGTGITTRYQYSDMDFFLLDNRYHRVAHFVEGVETTLLGEEQINWLVESLKESKAPFKLVAIGGQFLNPVKKFENYAQYEEERKKILDLIRDNGIEGVIFLTGDRHCTELSSLALGNGITVYDLTCSPLSSGPYDNSTEENTLRVDGTLVAERNYCTIDFTGKKGERAATITCFDPKGTARWMKRIEAPLKEKK